MLSLGEKVFYNLYFFLTRSHDSRQKISGVLCGPGSVEGNHDFDARLSSATISALNRGEEVVFGIVSEIFNRAYDQSLQGRVAHSRYTVQVGQYLSCCVRL